MPVVPAASYLAVLPYYVCWGQNIQNMAPVLATVVLLFSPECTCIAYRKAKACGSLKMFFSPAEVPKGFASFRTDRAT